MLEALCQRCGLCCDGSLFARVPLGPTEVVPGAALRVVTSAQGARHVPQPCAALPPLAEGSSACGVYAQRPLACRRYECLLYVAAREGEVGLDGALEVVARAKALVARARVEPAQAAAREEYLTFHFGRRP